MNFRNRYVSLTILLCSSLLVTSCANLKDHKLKTNSIVSEQNKTPDKETTVKNKNSEVNTSEPQINLSSISVKKQKKRNPISWFFRKKDKTTTGSISSSEKPDANEGHDANVLTLSNVLKKALSTNPDVVVASAQTAEALSGVKIAKTARRPSVDLSVLTGLESTHTDSTDASNIKRDEVNIQVRQTLFDFGESGNAIDRRKALLQSAKNREKDTKEQIALEIIESYLGFLQQSELVQLAAENVKVHTEIAKLIRLSEQGGNSTLADVKRVETRLDAANSAKLNNENLLKDSITAFKRLAETDPNKIKKPKNILAKSSTTLSGVNSNNLRDNPKLKSLHLDARSLERQLNKQNKALLPKIYALGEANYKKNVSGDTGVSKDYRAMIGMSWKLYDGGKNVHVSEQIQMRILEAEARYRKLYNELTENMENTKQELKSSIDKRNFLESSVNSAQKVMELYRTQFKAGERSAIEILDAQRDLYASKQELKNHNYQIAAAYYRELRIAGRLINTQFSLR